METKRKYLPESKRLKYSVYKVTSQAGLFYQLFPKGRIKKDQQPIEVYSTLAMAMHAAEWL